MSNILIVIEHAAGQPKKASLAAITFGQQAAAKSGGQLNLLVIGSGVGPVAESLKAFNAAKIYVVDQV